MNINTLKTTAPKLVKKVVRHHIILFGVVIVIVYGYVILQAQSLSNAQPSQSAINSQTSVSKPEIDQATVNKIKQLQDNNVNVQALFSQARQNPFQE